MSDPRRAVRRAIHTYYPYPDVPGLPDRPEEYVGQHRMLELPITYRAAQTTSRTLTAAAVATRRQAVQVAARAQDPETRRVLVRHARGVLSVRLFRVHQRSYPRAAVSGFADLRF